MTCKDCGGHVEWKGPLLNLTHTECSGCGAVDSQVDDTDRVCPNCEGDKEPEDDHCHMCANWLAGREP